MLGSQRVTGKAKKKRAKEELRCIAELQSELHRVREKFKRLFLWLRLRHRPYVVFVASL
jgi:hypothetical protein